MIPELGHFALALALALSFAQAAFGLVGAQRGSARLMEAAAPLAAGAALRHRAARRRLDALDPRAAARRQAAAGRAAP